MHKASRKDEFGFEAITNFLEAYPRLATRDQVLVSSIVSGIDNDLLTHFHLMEIGIGVKDLSDDSLRAQIEEFLALSSRRPWMQAQEVFWDWGYQV
jgi:hypothetical protein